MEVDEIESPESHMAVWRMLSKPMTFLLENPELAEQGLEALMMSIIQSKRDFANVLVPPTQLPKEIEMQYCTFNKWLLGRLFYILSDKNFSRYHQTSIRAQLKIFSVLYISEAPFCNEILTEYIVFFERLINYYYSTQKREFEILQASFLTTDQNYSFINNLDLTPITLIIKDVETLKKLIIYMMNLLCQLMILMNDLQNNDSRVLMKVLYCFKHYDADIKYGAIDFFINIINHYGFSQHQDFIFDFLFMLDDYLTNLELYLNDGSLNTLRYVSDLNNQLVRLFSTIQSLGGASDKKSNGIILNICKSLLGIREVDCYSEETNDDKCSIFSPELKISCFMVIDKIYDVDASYGYQAFNIIKYVNDIPSFFLALIMTEVNTFVNFETIDRRESHFSLYEISSTYKRIEASLFSVLEKCCDYNLDMPTLKQNLKLCSNILSLLQNFRIEYYSRQQQCKKVFLEIFHLKHNSDNVLNEFIKDELRLHIFRKENTTQILNALKNILYMFDAKKEEAVEEIMLCIDISMLTLSLSAEITFQDLLLILQLECFSLNPDKAIFDLRTYGTFSKKCHEKIHIHSLTILLVQHLQLGPVMDAEEWNMRITSMIDKLDFKNAETYCQMLELTPLLILNDILPSYQLITDYLHPALLTKNEDIHSTLLQMLPVIVCILYGHYMVVQTKNYRETNNIEFSISSMNGFNISFVCLHCYNSTTPSCSHKNIESEFDANNMMVLTEKSKLKYSDIDNILCNLKTLFEKFLDFKTYKNILGSTLNRLVLTFIRHSVFVPLEICDLWTFDKLEDLLTILQPFVTAVMQNDKINKASKNEILQYCINLLINSTKTSLKTNDSHEQMICLEGIKQFGLSGVEEVILPSMKMLIYFLMYPNTSFASKASYYIKIICESHNTTPNKVYHKYKKDLCQVMMSVVSFNYIVGFSFAQSMTKITRSFGFVGYREFILKDMHHALPYLIPLLAKSDKLKPIIGEISSVIPCTQANFIIERFPHIYTHTYLSELEEDTKICFDYIETITHASLNSLIKKHLTLILTELLLQYCSGKERVIRACKWLASMDEQSSPYFLNISMPLSQVADFIQPKFLGILGYFDNKLIHSKIALSVKRKALQSFPHILNLMGIKHMTPLKFKILAILRTALTVMKDYPELNAEAWNAFIRNVDIIALGPILTTIFVSMIPLLPKATNKINEIFEYLIVHNETLLSNHITDLFFLEDMDLNSKLKEVVAKHSSKKIPNNLVEKIRWYTKYLNQDINEIKVYALKYLYKLIKAHRIDLDNLIFGSKTINPCVVDLLEILIAGCRDKDLQVSDWSGRCIGQLGAVQPSILPQRPALAHNSTPFAFNVKDMTFVKAALGELTRAFQYEKHTKDMDRYALAIQVILTTFNISPQNDKSEVWNSFPDHMQQIMQPFLSSRYTIAFPTNPIKVHPVFGSKQAPTFNEWAYNWTEQMIPSIADNTIQDMLRCVYPALKKDQKSLILFLPYIILHSVLSMEDYTTIKEEILTVIDMKTFANALSKNEPAKMRLMKSLNLTSIMTSSVIEEGTHVKCCRVTYNLIDFFNRWLLEWSWNGPMKNSIHNVNYKKIKLFVSSFCNLTIARGNFLCGELERSLLYLEMYMEESADHIKEQLGFLGEIYSILNEPDSVAGVMSMKQTEPSLTELILCHKVTGDLQDAATCYEKYAQQGNIDDDILQGMVDVYLALDQPFTALRLLQKAEHMETGEGLAAEPFWRLAMFDDLDSLLKQPDVVNDDQWGVSVGHCLLALRGGMRDTLQDKLQAARCSVMKRLEGSLSYVSAEESVYPRAYSSVLCLHMLSEIGHAEEVLHSIKNLDDLDPSCCLIIDNLIEDWNLRLRLLQSSANTVEPVLRLRRILLEQSKDILQNTHPTTVSILENHIGKLWLQSAKFARKASIFQLAYIYILNGEQYGPKELFIEKGKLYWMRGQQEPAFCTLKRGIEEHFADLKQLSPTDRKLCAKAKLLIALYNDQTVNVDMNVNITHYKDAVEVYRQWEKSLVCLAGYFERVYAALGSDEQRTESGYKARTKALDCYGSSLQYGHSKIYHSMPRMLSIWLDFVPLPNDTQVTKIMCSMIEKFTERLPLYLFLTAFSQIISRICHPIKEVYDQIKSIIVKLILAYPQHALWMMMCVINSSYSQRMKRCQEILNDPRLNTPTMSKFIKDFKTLAKKLINICNKPVSEQVSVTYVSKLDKTLPILLASDNFSQIMMPHDQFVKIVLPSNKKGAMFDYDPFPSLIYIARIEDPVNIMPSLQKPKKVTFRGSDGNKYIVMLKPKDDLRKDFRLMEFNAVVNRYLQENPEASERRLYIRTYTVLPLNEECGLIQWVPNLVGLRPILIKIYKNKEIYTGNTELKTLACDVNDSIEKKRLIFEKQLIPKHPPVFGEWFRFTFADPHSWFQARTAYVRTTAVMSMVGYILGLGDRHGENILFDSTNGDSVHVDFNCLFNKGEEFLYPEKVPFRLTHNMRAAMGPLGYEGMYRKCCEITMRVLRAQTMILMSVIRPFVYDPLVAWQKHMSRLDDNERTNQQARDHLAHIEQRLQGMMRSNGKQYSMALSVEGQTLNLIQDATSVNNLCQMFIGWGPFL